MISIKKLFPVYVIATILFISVDYWGYAQPEKIVPDIAYTSFIFLFFSFLYSKQRTIATSDTTKQREVTNDETPFRKVFRIPSNPIRFIGFLMFAVFFALIWLGDQSIPIKIGFSVWLGFLVLYSVAEIIRAK